MVHFPGLALRSLCIQLRVTSKKLAGFPHSEISGSRDVCSSPELIAACHVLHRLHAPRHPPCALSSLTIKFAHHKNSASTTGLHFTPSSSEIQKIYFFGNFAYSIVKEHSNKLIKSSTPIRAKQQLYWRLKTLSMSSIDIEQICFRNLYQRTLSGAKLVIPGNF